MSTGLLVTLTVIEILALVVVLALFVIAITSRMRAVADALRQASAVLGAVQGYVCMVSPGAALLTRKLNAIADALPAIAEKAESLPLQKQAAPAAQQPARQQPPRHSSQAWTTDSGTPIRPRQG